MCAAIVTKESKDDHQEVHGFRREKEAEGQEAQSQDAIGPPFRAFPTAGLTSRDLRNVVSNMKKEVLP